jgi:hypothetical protein
MKTKAKSKATEVGSIVKRLKDDRKQMLSVAHVHGADYAEAFAKDSAPESALRFIAEYKRLPDIDGHERDGDALDYLYGCDYDVSHFFDERPEFRKRFHDAFIKRIGEIWNDVKSSL